MNEARDRRNNEMSPAPVQAERLLVRSDKLLIIDQFMLGNAAFLRGCLSQNGQAECPSEISEHIRKFGGLLSPWLPGKYVVLRSPEEHCLVTAPEDQEPLFRGPTSRLQEPFAEVLSDGTNEKPVEANVAIDTRCLVFLDFGLVENSALMERYAMLRAQSGEKPARDLLRENGAAVRYGFHQHGDVLQARVYLKNKLIILFQKTLEENISDNLGQTMF